MRTPSVNQPRDDAFVADAVASFAALRGFTVAFGGMTQRGVLRISSVIGGRGSTLEGLTVHPSRGLGGQALIERRPRMAADYGASTAITHDYDVAVLAEGIGSLIAVPVVVRGETRCVIYGGVHRGSQARGGELSPAVAIAKSLARELGDRDELSARLSEAEQELAELQGHHSVDGVGVRARAVLRESYAELRSIASGLTDDGLSERLAVVQNQLISLGTGSHIDRSAHTHLSPRELDVLSQVSLGRNNPEIALALGLTESTVKSYLAAAMSKLGSRTRHSAVAVARREGLIV